MNIDWMSRLAEEDREVRLTKWNGRACATDTRGLAVVHCHDCTFPESNLHIESVYNLKETLPNKHSTLLSELVAWADGYARHGGGSCPSCDDSGDRKCGKCAGTGIIECECDTCGNCHDYDCQECANGYVDCGHESHDVSKYVIKREL